MSKRIQELADQLQFNNDLVLAKKYMKRVGTEKHRIAQWENRVKQLRLKKKDPKKYAAQRRAIVRAQRTANKLQNKQTKRMSHITIDKKSQPIYEEDIDNNKQEQDWINEKDIPELEGENKKND